MDIVAVSSLMGRGSNASRGQDIFLFSKTSRPVLGPTQLPVKWVSKFLPGPKRLGCEVDHSLPVELYIFSFIRAFMAWTGKSLPFLQGSIGPACVSILPITRCLELHWEIQINHPTRCSNFSSLLLDVYVQLNMFRGVLTPIIRSSTTAVAASGFTIGAWW